MPRDWMAGDLDEIARDDARDGARELRATRQARDEAFIRERRFRVARDDMRQRSCSLLLSTPLRHANLLEAQRLARAAERVEEWRTDAWGRCFGG